MVHSLLGDTFPLPIEGFHPSSARRRSPEDSRISLTGFSKVARMGMASWAIAFTIPCDLCRGAEEGDAANGLALFRRMSRPKTTPCSDQVGMAYRSVPTRSRSSIPARPRARPAKPMAITASNCHLRTIDAGKSCSFNPRIVPVEEANLSCSMPSAEESSQIDWVGDSSVDDQRRGADHA